MRAPGEVIGGWTLVEPLGQGGMGTVWLVTRDGAEAALKTIHPHLARHPATRKRFDREVALGRRLDDAGLVRVLDSGEDAGEPWMAMERVEGPTLEDLWETGPLPEAEVRAMLAEVADTLVTLHDHGIVHRDIKPQNLIRDDRAGHRVRIMDLGIAREDDRTALTSTGQFIGSTRYAAPEQFQGSRDLDGRVDVYALGVVLFELLTGTAAYAGLSVPALYLAKHHDPLPAPSSIEAEVSPEMDAVVAWLTAAAPEDRPSARGAAEALRTGRTPDTLPGVAADTAVRLPPTNAPQPTTEAIGRHAQAQAVAQRLVPGALVTLMGTAGAGKTRLAAEVARLARGGWEGGVVWVDCEPATDAVALAERVAATLGSAASAAPIAHVGAALLARAPTLLVVDNLEQVPDARDALAAWDRAGHAVLATSRAPTGAQGERLEIVEPLQAPTLGSVEPADVARYPAVQLFLERARRVRPDFVLTESNASAVAEIVRVLDGLPLAIELAASRVAALDAPKLLARIQRSSRILRDRAGTGRHAALDAALEASWELLEPQAKAALAWCAVFAGAFDADDADEVWPLFDTFDDAEEPLDLLETLLDQSLLVRTGTEPVRFTLLRSIRAFARERLLDPDAVEGDDGPATGPDVLTALQERLAAHLAVRSGADLARWHDREEPRALDELASRLDDLVASAVVERGPDRLCAQGALAVLLRRGPLSALPTLAAAVDDPEVGPAAHFLVGRARLLASDLPGALASFDRAAAGAGPYAWFARAFRGATRLQAGDITGAEAELREVVRAAETDPSLLRAKVAALNALGKLFIETGEVQRARDSFAEAIRLLPPSARSLASSVHTNSGMLALRTGRLANAETSFRIALDHDRALGSQLDEAKVLTNLGIVAYHQGDPDRTRTLWHEALVKHRAVGNAESTAVVLGNLGELALENGDLEQARRRTEASVELKRTLGQPTAEAYGTVNLARIALRTGQHDRVLALCDRVLQLLAGDAGLAVRATSLLLAGEAHEALGDRQRALHTLSLAADTARRSGNPAVGTVSLARLAEIRAAAGDLDGARSLLDEADSLAGPASSRIVAVCARGQLEQLAGHREAACAHLDEARTLATQLALGPAADGSLAVGRLERTLGGS
ncbi:MAG: protein kinase [Alphaproteobacteria bacterium]|nr:protein kinase [Alphaproteobacteria bacterium]